MSDTPHLTEWNATKIRLATLLFDEMFADTRSADFKRQLTTVLSAHPDWRVDDAATKILISYGKRPEEIANYQMSLAPNIELAQASQPKTKHVVAPPSPIDLRAEEIIAQVPGVSKAAALTAAKLTTKLGTSLAADVTEARAIQAGLREASRHGIMQGDSWDTARKASNGVRESLSDAGVSLPAPDEISLVCATRVLAAKQEKQPDAHATLPEMPKRLQEAVGFKR